MRNWSRELSDTNPYQPPKESKEPEQFAPLVISRSIFSSPGGEAYWCVQQGEKETELTWEEMLGFVAAATMPADRPCLHWMDQD